MCIWKDNIVSKLQHKQMLVLLWKDWKAAFSSGFISFSSGFFPEFLERKAAAVNRTQIAVWHVTHFTFLQLNLISAAGDKVNLSFSANVTTPDPLYPWLQTEWEHLSGKDGSFPEVVEETSGVDLPERTTECAADLQRRLV